MGESGGGHGILMVARYIDQLRQTGFTQWGLPGGIFASSVSDTFRSALISAMDQRPVQFPNSRHQLQHRKRL